MKWDDETERRFGVAERPDDPVDWDWPVTVAFIGVLVFVAFIIWVIVSAVTS